MSARARGKPKGKILPAFGRDLLELRRRGLVPANERGIEQAVYVVLDDWQFCSHRRFRVVVPNDVEPGKLDFCFLAGVDVFVIWSLRLTPEARRDAVLRGILDARPRFLFVVDWDAPEHGFQIISRRDGLLRPEYC